MNNKEILDLINIFETSSLSRFKLDRGDFSLTLEKNMSAVTAESSAAVPAAELNSVVKNIENDKKEENREASNLIQVKAPLVGVYYAAPSPDELPYVKLGDRVEKGQVLCLVEAMKMMNELKAPEAGIIRAAKGVNGELVEFDQVLFEVEPC